MTCPCGRPLHYSQPRTQAMVEEFVRELGERVRITVGRRTFLVSRHYIALHGVRAQDLLQGRVPAEEISA